MGYCLYNGVRLHELPEYDEYDEYKYPCICIVELISPVGYTGTYALNMFTSDMEFYYGDSTKLGVISNEHSMWTGGHGPWSLGKEETNYDRSYFWTISGAANESASGYSFELIWSNFDVYNEDGSLFLAASDPVKLFDIKEWIVGHVIGMASKPMPRGGVDE